VISDETPFPIEPCKIEDVRYIVFRFQVSTDQKVGGSSPSKRTSVEAEPGSLLENPYSSRSPRSPFEQRLEDTKKWVEN